ncbi:uncharacterized protein LOC119095955 [Pollicipes pollicipes]|nr:uncharacterized protein LOC119095955 [Pollicipes pollicipes]
MTAGLWYAKPPGHMGDPLRERVMKFRMEWLELMPTLQTLAAHTQIVYKLDGPEFLEGRGRRSKIGPVILALNALGLEFLSQVRGVRPWTSSLADTLRVQHSVCLPLAANHTAMPAPLKMECLDENHAGPTVRAAAVGTLMNFVCGSTYPRPPAHCCSSAPRA